MQKIIKKKFIYEKLNSKNAFDLTKAVCKFTEWGLTELKMRHENMKSQLKKLWLASALIKSFIHTGLLACINQNNRKVTFGFASSTPQTPF